MSLDGSSAALRPTTAAAAAATGRPLTRRLREERKSCGAYLGKGCSLAAAATPTTTTAAENGYDNHPIGGRTPSRQEMETPGRGDQTPPPATPPPMAGGGAEGRVGGGGAGGGARAGGKARERKRRESAPVYGVDSKQEQQQRRLVDVGGVASEEEHEEGEGDWTHAELEEWATQEPAPRTPAVAVLPAGGSGDLEEEEGGGEEVGGMGARLARECETEGGPDPPVVTRVLPPGLEVRWRAPGRAGKWGRGVYV